MTKMKTVGATTLLLAAWTPAGVGQTSQSCTGSADCRYEKVAVIRCETEADGGIRVRNSSVTSATGVTVRSGDRCAATISSLLKAGLRMSYGRTVMASLPSNEVSFGFVFLAYYDDLDEDDEDDDDDD